MFFPHLFEADTYPALGCLPMCLRLKLDLAAVKVHLKTWNTVPPRERWALVCAPFETGVERVAFAARVAAAVRAADGAGPDALPAPPDPAPWERTDAVPAEVAARATRDGEAVTAAEWAAFHVQRRYALWKLAISRNDSANFIPALREFRAVGGTSGPDRPGSASPPAVDGAVLAGGKSTRFGSDKTRLALDGRTLVARAAGVLREAGLRHVRICRSPLPPPSGPNPPAAAVRTDAVPPLGVGNWKLEFPPEDILPDDVPGLGPAGGIATALLRAPAAVFAVAADMPALSAPLVKAVLAAWDGRSPAAAPWHDGRWEPLCALYTRDALPALYCGLAERSSLQDTLTGLPAQRIALPPALAAGLANVNTREDWEAFGKAGGGS